MVRLARKDELDQVVEVINDAKALFKSEGSDQWQDTDGYPNKESLENDLNRSELYVNVMDDVVVGCIVLSTLEEEAYDLIYDGNWNSSGKYTVIHRIAVRNGFYGKGIAKEMMEYVIEKSKELNVSSIKVDTKLTNTRMVSLLMRFDFEIVGKINLLRDGVLDKVRIALELVL